MAPVRIKQVLSILTVSVEKLQLSSYFLIFIAQIHTSSDLLFLVIISYVFMYQMWEMYSSVVDLIVHVRPYFTQVVKFDTS